MNWCTGWKDDYGWWLELFHPFGIKVLHRRCKTVDLAFWLQRSLQKAGKRCSVPSPAVRLGHGWNTDMHSTSWYVREIIPQGLDFWMWQKSCFPANRCLPIMPSQEVSHCPRVPGSPCKDCKVIHRRMSRAGRNGSANGRQGHGLAGWHFSGQFFMQCVGKRWLKQDITRYNKITIRSCPQLRAIKKQEHINIFIIFVWECLRYQSTLKPGESFEQSKCTMAFHWRPGRSRSRTGHGHSAAALAGWLEVEAAEVLSVLSVLRCRIFPVIWRLKSLITGMSNDFNGGSNGTQVSLNAVFYMWR